MGLNPRQMLSERWGVERGAGSHTRVWAQLAYAPPIPPDAAQASGLGGGRSSCNGRPNTGRAAATRRRRPREENR